VPGFFSLVRRRQQLLASSKSAQRRLDEAQAIVDIARQQAEVAKARLEEQRGAGAVPNAEEPRDADLALIAALDAYDQVRRAVEVPLDDALQAWKRSD
jgi:exonuclease VII small subunit